MYYYILWLVWDQSCSHTLTPLSSLEWVWARQCWLKLVFLATYECTYESTYCMPAYNSIHLLYKESRVQGLMFVWQSWGSDIAEVIRC